MTCPLTSEPIHTPQLYSLGRAAFSRNMVTKSLKPHCKESFKHYEKNSSFETNDFPTKSKQPPSGQDQLKTALFITLAVFFIRIFRFNQPNAVVPDEVSVIQAINLYNENTFFMDNEPPLGKLLYFFANSAYTSLFPQFSEAGSLGYENIPFGHLRILSIFFGSLLAPLAYLTAQTLNYSQSVSILCAFLVALEAGLATQTRFIFLDSQLLLFIALSFFAWCKFVKDSQRKLSAIWLMVTGISIGFAISIRWSGFYTLFFFVGCAVFHLWNKLNDKSLSMRDWGMYSATVMTALVGIPFAIYILSFHAHLDIARNHSSAAIHFSPEFQMNLDGFRHEKTSSAVSFGSTITLYHVGTNGGFLHSHRQTYPEGSKQQQITCYPYIDTNNMWSVQRETDSQQTNSTTFVSDGDIIRLYHIMTDTRLHSHDVRPIITSKKHQNEVSSYGWKDFAGDSNDFWRVIIVKNNIPKKHPLHGKLVARRTLFRLQHVNTGCFLFSHNMKLPSWGFGQQEVTCGNDALIQNSIWAIEDNINDQYSLDNRIPMVDYKRASFFEQMKEIHYTLFFKQDESQDEHLFQSNPTSWVFLKKGLRLWEGKNKEVHLVGNPFIWLSSTFSVIATLILFGIYILQKKRKMNFSELYENELKVSMFLAMSWAGHLFPYYFKGPRLFLFHYLPSLYFSILLFSHWINSVTGQVHTFMKWTGILCVATVSIYFYYQLLPWMLGLEMNSQKCENRRYFSSWDFNCANFGKSLD